MKSKMQALSGVRVLDLGRMFAAPWAGQMLADLGADVIKVERLEGDEIRRYGPPFLCDPEGHEMLESAYSLAANRGKRSIAVNLATEEGCEIVRRLALASDVLIENFKVGDLARRGLGSAQLLELKPSLIYCSLSAFGQTGPYARRPGVDTSFQAMSGLMSVTGDPSGDPQKMGVVMSDLIAGLYAAIGILAALRHRETQEGPGQHIDLALLDTSVAALSHRAVEFFLTGNTPQRVGNGSPGNVPARTFHCKEGILAVQAGGDIQFKRLCQALERTDLLRDERFATRRRRIANESSLSTILDAVFASRTAREWFAMLETAGVYCGVVNTVAEAFKDPQVLHRGLQQTMKHAVAGPLSLVANPIRFSETPIEAPNPPPMLGEHTAEILKEVLGFDAAKIASLLERNVIGAARG